MSTTAANPETLDRASLINRIQTLGPWHMNIQLTEELSTGQAFSDDGSIQDRPSNSGVSLLSLRDSFLRQIDAIYPEGITDKTFLDCACNAGGYCFWTREREIKNAFGFDVREHWIRQARFVKTQRVVQPTDRIQFRVSDLYELPNLNLPPRDITMFKGIFYHLPEPIHGLKIAADLTNEVMFFNTSTTWGLDDGFMQVGWESRENVMSGVHGLKWYPTGPRICGEMLKWLGFVEMKEIFYRQQHDQPQLGRTEIVASKVKGLLENLPGTWIE
jgi:SAM-dependent methyltransferase